jgi:hypothetical protein
MSKRALLQRALDCQIGTDEFWQAIRAIRDYERDVEMKETKAQAEYSEPTRTAERCGLCSHYRIGVCTKVEGSIDPRMWCRHFKRREDI